MKVVVVTQREYDVTNCARCPFVRKLPCRHSPFADDYHCGATPDNKKIDGYVEWEDQLPKVPPEWCPMRNHAEPVMVRNDGPLPMILTE